MVIFFIGATVGFGVADAVADGEAEGVGVGVGVTSVFGATYFTLIVGAEKVKPLATKFTQPLDVVNDEVETFCSPDCPITETVALALLKVFPQKQLAVTLFIVSE